MKSLCVSLALLIMALTSYSQTKDYCFQSDNSWTELNKVVCFDSQTPFEMGIYFAKAFDKNYTQPVYYLIENKDQQNVLDSAFVIQEKEGSSKGITRFSFNISKNLRLSIATLPFDKNGYDKAQIVVIAKTDGECQLVCDGSFEKKKTKTNNNTSLYSAEPIVKTITVDDKKVDLDLSLYYADGMTLRYVQVGGIRIRI